MKRQKIDDLALNANEWAQVKSFNDLLAVRCRNSFIVLCCSLTNDHGTKQHADNAQHAFSSDKAPTLHLALPALEAIHKAWTTRQTREKYKDFLPALKAGLTKIEEYYDRTSDSDAYTFAMRCVPLLTVPYHCSQLIKL